MANVVENLHPTHAGDDFWDRPASPPRARTLRRLESRQRAAIRRARVLLCRKTLGPGDEAVLARMQGVAREYAKYHDAMLATIRLELF